MRINLRGGVWKNSEDEVLKAAVMKYGLNNWARVASLLSRKTARQCKARWYEWIDPAVKKAEWTLEEEERLLHLAKVFPSQWRTIAPLVGRTAHQCLQHYEKLLDIAQGRGGEMADDDPRKLRPGDIDPAPETKPSRADAVDMDEDELEMLAEARARLANTRGKKAKRKAREKQMEAAKRLAQLQKKRELKAAGIGVSYGSGKKNKGDMHDHAVDIAFEKKPLKGPFNTIEENPQFTQVQKNVSLQKVEGIRRDAERKRLEDQDRRRLKKLKEDHLPEALKIIEEMNNPIKRKKYTALNLPEPELAEEDVLDIVKIGRKGGQFDASLNLAVDPTGQEQKNKAVLNSGQTSTKQQLIESATLGNTSFMTEDLGLKKEIAVANEKKRQREWEEIQSTAVRKKMPRPVFIDQTVFRSVIASDDTQIKNAEEKLMSEMKALVYHDVQVHAPVKNMITMSLDTSVQPLINDITRRELDEASKLIQSTCCLVLQHGKKAGIIPENEDEIDLDSFLIILQDIEKKDMDKAAESDVMKAIKLRHEADIKRLRRYEKSYEKLTKGYTGILEGLANERSQLVNDIVERQRNLEALHSISQQEEAGMVVRMNVYNEEVELNNRHHDLLH